MKRNPRNEHEEMSLDRVTRLLRAISAVKPPESLKNRLIASIPSASAGRPVLPASPVWLQRIRWAGAVAAAVLVMSAIAWFGVPAGRRARPIADMNGASARATAADHNNLRPSDANLYDINGLR